jgi:hypothetical protein
MNDRNYSTHDVLKFGSKDNLCTSQLLMFEQFGNDVGTWDSRHGHKSIVHWLARVDLASALLNGFLGQVKPFTAHTTMG